MNIFQEQNGDYSMTRFILFACTIGGIGLAYIGVWRGLELLGLASLVTGIIASGVAGKVVQKGKEQKNG